MFSAFTELANSLSLDNLQQPNDNNNGSRDDQDYARSSSKLLHLNKIRELEEDARKLRAERETLSQDVNRIRGEKSALISERDSALQQLNRVKSESEAQDDTVRIPTSTYEKIKDRTVQLMERYDATKKELESSQETAARGIKDIYDSFRGRHIFAPTEVISISTLPRLKDDIIRAFSSMESELSLSREKCFNSIRDLNDEVSSQKERIRSLETQLTIVQDESQSYSLKEQESERIRARLESELSIVVTEKAELISSMQAIKESLLADKANEETVSSLVPPVDSAPTSSSISITQLSQVLEKERRERVKLEIKMREMERSYSHKSGDLFAHEKQYLKTCFMTLVGGDSGGNLRQVIRVVCRILDCSPQEEAEMLIKMTAESQNRDKMSFSWF